jgi:PKD repeat protein
VSHNYPLTGTYTVSLTVSGLGGEDTETKVEYIYVHEFLPPVAEFSADPISGTKPLEVAFTNVSTGTYDTCLWDFGDDESSTDCNDPSHTYDERGTFDVSLTVSGPGGEDTETKVDYIAVYRRARADFVADPTSGIAPLTVTFEDEGKGDFDNCFWEFGDGGTSDRCGDPDPEHTYQLAGSYTVTMTVSGLGGTDTKVRENYITVYEPVAAGFSGEPLSGTLPLTVTFTNTSTGHYDTCAWDFGDGGTSGQCMNPSYTYTEGGTYTVTLTASGLGGEDTETKVAYVTVYEPPVADFEGVPLSGVVPLTVTFTNLSTGDFDSCAWEFGDGGTSSSCGTVSHNYPLTGTYTVSLAVSGLGGSDSETKVDYIYVHEFVPPEADFSADPISGIKPLAVEFTNLSTGDYDSCLWEFGDGGSSTDCSDPSHTYDDSGLYSVSLTVSGLGGEDTETKTDYITIYEPVAAGFSGEPLSGTRPLTVTFTNLSSGDYDSCLWEFGDGETSSDCEDPSHTYELKGTYTVSFTVSGLGGSDTETKASFITVYEPVTADFSATPLSGTLSLMVEFTNMSTGDFDTCSWDFGDGSTRTNCEDVSHLYTAPGSYTVSLTVSGPGGEDTMTKTDLIVVEKPEALIYMPILLR